MVVARVVGDIGAVRERLRAKGLVVTGHQLDHPVGASVAHLRALQSHVATTHHRQHATAIGAGDVQACHACDLRGRVLVLAAALMLNASTALMT